MDTPILEGNTVNNPEAILKDPAMVEALIAVKNSLPNGEDLDKAKMVVIIDMISQIMAMVELLKEELADITEFEARVDKFEQLEWAKLNHLVKSFSSRFLLADTKAGASHLMVLAGVAVAILVR